MYILESVCELCMAIQIRLCVLILISNLLLAALKVGSDLFIIPPPISILIVESREQKDSIVYLF